MHLPLWFGLRVPGLNWNSGRNLCIQNGLKSAQTRPLTINWGVILEWMDFHSSLSCATSGFVINLTPVYHLRVASAVSWLRREQRSWFCRHEKAQDSLHQKDLTILLFPTPACTCSRLERGQWSDCHTGTFPPSGISSVCSWPVILGARISIHGQ